MTTLPGTHWLDLDAPRPARAVVPPARGRAQTGHTKGPIMRARLNVSAWLAKLAVAAIVFTGVASAQRDVSTSDLIRFPDAGVVEGAASTLLRGPDAIAVVMHTSGLAPAAPYTLWWVVFNQPQACLGGVCDEDDLFNVDGTLNLNAAGDISILYALTDARGAADFSAVLVAGSPLGEVVVGPGLRDAATAEVHVVVRSHGPLEPDRAYQQLTTFEAHPIIGGDCAVCADEQFAVHPPVAVTAQEVEIPWYVLTEVRAREARGAAGGGRRHEPLTTR
jgi:hypothetical protein